MPIYEYHCPECGTFEAVQKVSDEPLKCRPDCDNKNCPKSAEKMISASAFHLKGGGWYKSDYASGGGSGAGKSKKNGPSGDSSGGSSDSSKSESSKSGDKSGGSSDGGGGSSGGGSCGSGCGCH